MSCCFCGDGVRMPHSTRIIVENVTLKDIGPTEAYRCRNREFLLEASRNLKNRRTKAEKRLWSGLKGNRLGTRFRQQQIIGNFITDFYCHEHAIIIEVDGGIHDNQKEKDQARDAFLKELGFMVVRFRNEQVFNDLKGILREIRSLIEKKRV